MQLLHSPRSLTLSNDVPYCGFRRSPSLLGQVFQWSCDVRCPQARTFKAIDVRPHASGGERLRVKAAETTPADADLKDQNLIFVAGATGRVGSRTVRELLKLGSKVRAGVRSVQRAESLVQSVRQMKLDADASGFAPPIERLEIVQCDLEKKNQIGPALGNASTVICCIGASEKEVFDITGPYRIDYQATKNLIDAATFAEVDHFILLTSLGTNKVGFPAAILNLFWGVLIWKRKAEEALLASGLPYTIVRPGGMERPTDSFKETHNMTVSEADTLFGGQVSNLQVAELLAFMAKNPGLSCCKVVEVIAETTAPLTPMSDLLKKIQSQRIFSSKVRNGGYCTLMSFYGDLLTSQELGDAVEPRIAVPKSFTSESPSPSVEKVSTQTKSIATTPLSPYIAYEDLKPPTSPTPTPSTGSVALKGSVAGTVPSEAHTSPSSAKVNSSSPYVGYPDLKPPASPSPNAPGSSKGSEVGPPIDEKLGDADKHISRKATPLSPFTMYEDMKPPTSPMPSPKKL